MTTWKVLITDGLSDKGLAILNSAAQVDNRRDIPADELLNVAGEYMHLRQADQLGQERLRRLVARLDEQAPTSGAD